MEEDIKKKKRKKLIFLGVGVVVTGVLGFFGWDQYQKYKDKKAEDTDPDGTLPSNEKQTNYLPPPPAPKPQANDEFPLKKGSKSARVKQLQEALIAKYGKAILPKYGADSDFG